MLIPIILAIFVKLYLSFVVYGPLPSQFAPDENTYAELNKWILLGGRAADFPLSGGDLFFTALSFNIPTIGFISLGVTPIFAIRLTSNLYSLLSILLIYRFFSDLKRANIKLGGDKYFERFTNSLIFIYLFLPSHFIWGTLGIRESANEFWLIATFYSVHQILFDRKKFNKYILLCLCIILLYFSRPQIGYLAILVITCLGITVILREKEPFFLISALGSWLLIALLNIPINSYLQPHNSLTNQSSNSETVNLVLDEITTPIDELINLTNLQISKSQGANSAVVSIKCPDSYLTNISIICKFYQIPTSSLNYLSRPIFFVDTLDSTIKKFAAIENLFWILMSIYILTLTIKSRKYLRINLNLKILLIAFIILFISLSGLYEGNYGTAFRHKSLLLPVFLIIMMVLRSDLLEHRKSKTIKKNRE